MINTRVDKLRLVMENVALGYFSRYLSLSLPIAILLATYILSYILLQMDNGLVNGHKLTQHETEKNLLSVLTTIKQSKLSILCLLDLHRLDS